MKSTLGFEASTTFCCAAGQDQENIVEYLVDNKRKYRDGDGNGTYLMMMVHT
ncbi:MAG TPA: hypothetical protein VEP90_16440 [Methylomirabilota bacterium]|nr:hypothetical protein [Methylomirabilota bacterium]